MNEDTKVFDENVEEEVNDTSTDISSEDPDGGALGYLIVGLVGATAAIAAFVYKNKEKIKEKAEERSIRRLEKKGYVVSKVEDAHDEERESSDEHK